MDNHGIFSGVIQGLLENVGGRNEQRKATIINERICT